jgi:hypothetical protein
MTYYRNQTQWILRRTPEKPMLLLNKRKLKRRRSNKKLMLKKRKNKRLQISAKRKQRRLRRRG